MREAGLWQHGAVIACGLAVGTNLREVDIGGSPEDLTAAAGIIGDLQPGDVTQLRCDGLPSVVWPVRVPRLELVHVASSLIRIDVDPHRLRVEFAASGARLLRSVLEGVASDDRNPDRGVKVGAHAHLEHLDGFDDGLAPDSLPLVVSAAEHVDSLRSKEEALLRVLLSEQHTDHPAAAAALGALLIDDRASLSFGVSVIARAMLADDLPACHDAEADVLVELLAAPVPSWGIDGVMDRFLVGQATETVDSRRAAIGRVLDAWTRPGP